MSLLSKLIGPRQAFDGGLFLPDQKSIIARQPIQTLAPDGLLRVPLTAAANLPVEVTVKVGQRVIAGEPISRALTTDALPAHAPVAGHVTEISRTWSPFDGLLPAAFIEPDGTADAVSPNPGWEDESLIIHMAECGVMCELPRMPLHQYLQQAVATGVTDLIVNAMETEPFVATDLRTIVEQPGRMVDATCELADALGVLRAIIAVPFRHRRIVHRLKSEAADRMVEVVSMADPYPQCHPHLLIKAILQREIAPGMSPLDERAVVLPLAAVRAAADALLGGLPVTHAVLTVSGDAIEQPGVYRIPVGMPVERLVNRLGLRGPVEQAIMGGPLTGVPLGDAQAVITRESNALLLFLERELVTPTDCIRCGWCVDDCPVGIVPPDLMRLDVAADCTAVDLSHLKACIDCGLCTYVCPSQLPLAQTIRRARTRFARPSEMVDTTA